MLWVPGALIGGLLAYQIDADVWAAGAVVGALVGLIVAPLLPRPPAHPASRELETRLTELTVRLDSIDRRLADLERADLRAERADLRAPAATAPSAPASPVAAPPESAPVESLAARTETSETFASAVEPTVATAPPPPPDEPGIGKALQEWPIWRWLTGGNTVVRVGVVILFFGVAFLLKYASDRFDPPIELRLAGVAAGALVLLVLGWRLRARRPDYALTLQGAGIGILYLVIFTAFRLYHLLPPVPAFALLVAVAALSAVIAVAQDALALAALGTSAGFLAPILASTGAGSHVMLFSYYLVLNGAILAIAVFKAWRVLNLVGFAFTFVIGTVWGVTSYRPEHFASTQPFLGFFFAFYLAIPVLFARRRAAGLERYVDTTLVFGVPLVAFGLQVSLVHDIEYATAWSALALSAIYLGLAKAVFGRRGEALRLLAEAFLALGVVFGSLAIPLALEGRWTSAAWALEGAAIVWIGVRQRRLPARTFGIALQFLAGAAFLADSSRLGGGLVVNSAYLGCVLLALGGLFCAWYLDRHRAVLTEPERIAAVVLFVWGVAWWAGGALVEIDRHLPSAYHIQAALVFLTASCAAFSWLHSRIDWRPARYPAQAVTPLMIAVLAASAAQESHPLAHLGYAGWPFAFTVHVLLLRRHHTPGSRYQYWAHAAGVWLLAALGSWEITWRIDRLGAGHAVWPIIALALAPAALLTALALRGTRIAGPVASHRDAYLTAGSAPLAVFLVAWGLLVNLVTNGDPAPLPYLPILSPLDLAELGALLTVALWYLESHRLALRPIATIPRAHVVGALAGLVFVWMNAVLLRTLHHWGGVPFRLEAMVRSDVVQTAFSILWSLIALASMGVATRRGLRPAWIAGAILMAVVVLKLFTVDLSNVGTVQRIVSFVGVGILMLVLGYFSPVPPRSPREAR